MLSRIDKISEESGFRIANIFHAGDGNLHPLVLFDARKPGETEKAIDAGSACLQVCAEAGGTITGEHGVGLKKKKKCDLSLRKMKLLPKRIYEKYLILKIY